MQIQRRRVFFIEGYEPKGADGFYYLFKREWNRFRDNWNVSGTVGNIQFESNDIASWTVETSGPNWHVSTTYEFLRLENQIRLNLAQPFPVQMARTIRWIADDIATGTLWRVFRASGRMGVLLAYSQAMLAIWFALALGGGWFAANAASGFPTIAQIIITIAAFSGVLALLYPVARAMFVNQLNNCWPYLRDYARGEATDFDRSVDILAKRIVVAAKAADADEILVVGHSAGAMLALTAMKLALDADPDLGIRRPEVCVITAGSIMPIFALHPAAKKLRATVKAISRERTIQWADCQSHEDFMNFCPFDPVADVGIESGPERCNPSIWQIPFQAMIAPGTFKKMRFNYWRKHYQYIMSNERRATYDYFMFVCGPAPFSVWAAQNDLADSFAPDGTYLLPVLKAAE